MSRSPLRALAERDLGWAVRVGRSPRGTDLRRRSRPIVYLLMAAMLLLIGGMMTHVYGSAPVFATVCIAAALLLILACWPAYNRWELSSHVLGAAEHRLCAWCAYDLNGLRPDPRDGCTVCPECGAAWKLEEGTEARRHEGTEG